MHVLFNSVSSGGRVMAFFWHENELFVNQGQTNDDNEGWTKFLMETKKPMKVKIYSYL